MKTKKELEKIIDAFFHKPKVRIEPNVNLNKDIKTLSLKVKPNQLRHIYFYYCKKEVELLNKSKITKKNCSLKNQENQDNPIQVDKVIGDGYSGIVYSLKNETDKVIKIVNLNTSFNRFSDISKKVKNEIAISKKAGKLGIAPIIYDSFACCDIFNNCYYAILMEKINGETLDKKLQKINSKKQMDELCDKVLKLIQKLGKNGIIHNDLHTDNIMITPENEVKFIDFGISRTIKEIQETFIEKEEEKVLYAITNKKVIYYYPKFHKLIHYLANVV